MPLTPYTQHPLFLGYHVNPLLEKGSVRAFFGGFGGTPNTLFVYMMSTLKERDRYYNPSTTMENTAQQNRSFAEKFSPLLRGFQEEWKPLLQIYLFLIVDLLDTQLVSKQVSYTPGYNAKFQLFFGWYLFWESVFGSPPQKTPKSKDLRVPSISVLSRDPCF